MNDELSQKNMDDALTEVRSTEQFLADLGSYIRARVGDLNIDEREAVDSLPQGSALLIVRRGPNLGARFLLDQQENTAGRHQDAAIFLDDITVSRKHAKFVRNVSGTFSVVDLGSLNGTYVNGKCIEEPTILEDGAEIQVGKFKFTFFASRFDVS